MLAKKLIPLMTLAALIAAPCAPVQALEFCNPETGRQSLVHPLYLLPFPRPLCFTMPCRPSPPCIDLFATVADDHR